MRKIARVDANQADMVAALREYGYSVHITSQLGDGFTDIVVGAYGLICVLVEIKDPAKPPSQRELTPAEKKFKEKTKAPYIVALYPIQVINYIESLAEKMRKAGILN